ncbi:AraC family transcriptional regulator [Flavobacteriaceae bacterium MHTCC 0001]
MASQFQSLKLNLLHAGYAELDDKWNFNNVISPFSRLYLITGGEAHVYYQNNKIKLLPGYMYLIPSFTFSSYKCDTALHQYYIGFLETLGDNMSIYTMADFKYEVKATVLDSIYFERLLSLNPNRNLINNDPEKYDNYPSLLEFKNRNVNVPLSKLLETQGILKVLLSRFILKKTKMQNNKKMKLVGVLNHISEHLHEKLTVGQLAEFCHLTTDHFSKSFKISFGLGPSKYIQLRRVERAQSLLITTNSSMETIAEAVGFGNVSYFSRTFKDITNKTPNEFRKENLVS